LIALNGKYTALSTALVGITSFPFTNDNRILSNAEDCPISYRLKVIWSVPFSELGCRCPGK
jgi:hypothetical protein